MKTTVLWYKYLIGLAVLYILAAGPKSFVMAEDLTSTAGAGATVEERTKEQGKFSLIEAAPELYYSAMRYHKFFGDANTTHGNIFERTNLIGDPGGVRQMLVDHGLYLDFGVTQFLQRNFSGGDEKNTRSNGSTDAWLWYDTGKAGLWPGGAVYLHGERRWRSGINKDVGSSSPANMDQTMPDTDPNDSNWALSEWYILQHLSENFLAAAGKMNFASWGDTNMFANRERSQFVYSGLVNNPIPGVFFPYTTLIGWLNWSPSKAHSISAVYGMTEGSATESMSDTFDTLSTKDNAYVLQYIYATEIAGRPGRFLLDAAYSTKEIPSFDISERQLIGELTGTLPVDEESDNYALVSNFAQYLYVEEGSAEAYNRRLEANPHSGITHHNAPPVGFGIFGRAGWSPKDRNVIDQFYSFGIGGYGVLIPDRNDDQWGLGWAGSHISSDVRDLTDELRSWEHAFEVFYNFWLTPAVHLSIDSQVIRPANEDLDTAWTMGLRLQLDF